MINSTFFNNYVTRGLAGASPNDPSNDNGADAGGAIFSFSANLYVQDSTFSGNQSTGSGAAIVVFNDNPSRGQAPLVSRFYLYSTIIANNGANECFIKGPLTYGGGAGNLITHNGVGNAPDGPFLPCQGWCQRAIPCSGSCRRTVRAIRRRWRSGRIVPRSMRLSPAPRSRSTKEAWPGRNWAGSISERSKHNRSERDNQETSCRTQGGGVISLRDLFEVGIASRSRLAGRAGESGG